MKSPPWAVRMASARPMCAPASLRGNALLRMDLPRTSPALVIHPSQRHGALPLALRMRHEVILARLALADTRARPANPTLADARSLSRPHETVSSRKLRETTRQAELSSARRRAPPHSLTLGTAGYG